MGLVEEPNALQLTVFVVRHFHEDSYLRMLLKVFKDLLDGGAELSTDVSLFKLTRVRVHQLDEINGGRECGQEVDFQMDWKI